MLRRICLLVLIVLLALAAVPSYAWKFASIADSRGDNNGVNTTILTKIVNCINAENVDLVIFAGDAVNGSSSDATTSSQMDTWVSVMNNLNCPWYYSPGNHEIQTATAQENVLRAKVDMPLNGPAGDLEMVYSFDHQNAHFVSLNSNHYGQVHHVQRSWLTTDLAATTQPHVFVYAHEPAYPAGPHIGSSLDVYPSERDDLWNIMSNNNVAMYFCGHEHLYQRTTHGTVRHIINGTCGAPIHTGYPETVAKYHYVVVDVNGYDVQCTAKDENAVPFDSWSYSVTSPLAIADVKALPDGTAVTLSRRVVAAGTDQMTFTFYVEETDRSAGIRVYAPNKVAPYGSLVTVTGTMATSSGERTINCSTVTVVAPSATVPDPLCMLTREVGGGALNDYTPGVKGGVSAHNSGLLVEVCGRVTFVDTIARRFWVDDGCGVLDGSGYAGMCVSYGGLVTGNVVNPPAQDAFVKVTGISARRISGTDILPVIRVRNQADIVSH